MQQIFSVSGAYRRLATGSRRTTTTRTTLTRKITNGTTAATVTHRAVHRHTLAVEFWNALAAIVDHVDKLDHAARFLLVTLHIRCEVRDIMALRTADSEALAVAGVHD